jgi:hypothetical protein
METPMQPTSTVATKANGDGIVIFTPPRWIIGDGIARDLCHTA